MSALDQPASPVVAHAGSSFYTAMRILPRPQRDAMYEIYAFCRAVDDIADEGGTREERRAGLAGWRADIAAMYRGAVTPRTAGLAQHVARFELAQADFVAVIDGMAMDAEDDIQAPPAATLDLYCDRVASAVGRLSVRIFGLPPQAGLDLAHHLGRALQLTNILRDIDEDAGMNRLYLPREALVGAGIAITEPRAVVAHPSLEAACRPLLAQAHDHFSAAEAIMAGQPKALVRAPRIMAVVYRMILDKLVVRGFAPPRPKARIPKLRLVLTVARHGLF